MDTVPKNADRDFTASAFVVQDGHVLLIDHDKLGRWLQPGGHVEREELPDETAIREVREETGVEINIVDANSDALLVSQSRPRPFDVNLHRVRDDHWHCDFTYLATVEGRDESHESDEHNGQRWFSRSELESTDYDVDGDTRTRALAALEYLD